MAESLKNDDKSIRSYILNDVLEKVPIDKSYENLCKVIGNDAIAFYDFQYWYYRFLSGNQDLDFDRSFKFQHSKKDQISAVKTVGSIIPVETGKDLSIGTEFKSDTKSKLLSTPEPLQFSDLPVDAVGLIVDKLEVVERLMLRKVSKPLREFIEKQLFDCTEIAISCSQDLISIRYGNARIIYAKSWDVASFYELFSYLQESLSIYGDHFESEAFNDLAWILKNSKLQLRPFEFSHMLLSRKNGVVSKFFNKFELLLKSLKHQIAVRELDIQPKQPDGILAILPYLKPGYLEKITIDNEGGIDDWKSEENVRKVDRIMQSSPLLQSSSTAVWKIMDPDEVDDFLDFIGVPGPSAHDYLSVRH
ncbi:unnamed protein product [Caenorhabditis brenneri]